MRRSWITFLRILRYGLHNFARNAWLSTAATAVMVLTLSILLVTYSVQLVFKDTVSKVRQKIDVSIYLTDDITDVQRQKFTAALKALPIVTAIDYINKDQARQIFVDENKSFAEQLDALGQLGEANPFPASLRVHTGDADNLDSISNLVKQKPYDGWQSAPASIVGPRRDAITTIERVAQFSEMAGLVASVVFVSLSIMIIFNTIRMAIFNRRDEIEIMKLIGAQKRFIRGPFIVEASLYGVFAAVVSVALMYGLLLAVQPGLNGYDIDISQVLILFTQWPEVIFGIMLGIGVLIGMVSSTLAMRRYLRV